MFFVAVQANFTLDATHVHFAIYINIRTVCCRLQLQVGDFFVAVPC